jgi:hypothetical protein
VAVAIGELMGMCTSKRVRSTHPVADLRVLPFAAAVGADWLIGSVTPVAVSPRSPLAFDDDGPDDPARPLLGDIEAAHRDGTCRILAIALM